MTLISRLLRHNHRTPPTHPPPPHKPPYPHHRKPPQTRLTFLQLAHFTPQLSPRTRSLSSLSILIHSLSQSRLFFPASSLLLTLTYVPDTDARGMLGNVNAKSRAENLGSVTGTPHVSEYSALDADTRGGIHVKNDLFSHLYVAWRDHGFKSTDAFDLLVHCHVQARRMMPAVEVLHLMLGHSIVPEDKEQGDDD